MSQQFYLTSFGVSLALAMTSVHAVKPVLLHTIRYADLQQIIQLTPVAVKSPPGALDTLQFVKQHRDKNNITHVRMQQYYAGFPVFGGYAIVHHAAVRPGMVASDADKMNGVVYTGLANELGQPLPSFRDQAKAALQHHRAAYSDGQISEEHVASIVYIDTHNKPFWAYKVSVLVQYKNKMPERPTAIIDAQTGKPIQQWNDLKTLRSDVRGRGFGGNDRIGQYKFGKDKPVLMLSRDDETATCYMENTMVKIVDMAHRYQGNNHTMQYSCPVTIHHSKNFYWTGYHNDGYDVENGAYSPSNDALYAGEIVQLMYKKWYDLDALTVDGKPMQLVMRVHYGDKYENAYWDGKQMTFGDGDTMMYPLTSIGVGAHEISHGFTEQHADLVYFGQSGAMNESFSDMAAQTAEYYASGGNNWSIGSEIMKEQSGYQALRFMDKPSRDGKSIDSASQYKVGMNVHYSSGVYNRLFYLLANQPDWGIQTAFKVMVKANVDYWTPYSTFEQGGCGIIYAAADLHLPVEDVKRVLEQVAISPQQC